MHTLAAWTVTISWTASQKRIKRRRHAQWKEEDSRLIVRVVGYVCLTAEQKEEELAAETRLYGLQLL